MLPAVHAYVTQQEKRFGPGFSEICPLFQVEQQTNLMF